MYHCAFPGKEDCQTTTITKLTSPDGQWDASVVEALCDEGLSGLVLGVAQIAPAGRTGEDIQILGLETGGGKDELPGISWTEPKRLKVVVPFAIDLKIAHRKIPGLMVDVELDSDNPEQKSLFAKEMHDSE